MGGIDFGEAVERQSLFQSFRRKGEKIMPVNEMSLIAAREDRAFSADRLLGILGMIGAPMLLVETILRIINILPQNTDNGWIGLIEMIYIGGWMALAAGMRRLRVTGNGLGSKIVFAWQMIGLVLAFLFTVQVIFGAGYDRPPVSVFFKICDLGFPFSHLWMLVVGALVWRAGVWRGWLRVAPFLVGVVLALFMAGLGRLVDLPQGATVFAVSTAAGLFSLAYGVFKNGAKTI